MKSATQEKKESEMLSRPLKLNIFLLTLNDQCKYYPLLAIYFPSEKKGVQTCPQQGSKTYFEGGLAMLKEIEMYFNGGLKPLYWVLFFPLYWVPWIFEGQIEMVAIKALFLLLPLLLFVSGIWATVLGVASSLLRQNRSLFISTLLVTWWDAGKSVVLYWGGLFRFAFLSIGWSWAILKIIVLGSFYMIKEIIFMPLTFLKSITAQYFLPGVPWLAVLFTISWIGLEAFIFSYILTPMTSDIISQLADSMPPTSVVTTSLFFFLFFVIGGSFAAMSVMVDSLKQKDYFNIFKMIAIEMFIMFFEVMFLYREFVDSLAPWMAQMTNDSVQLGLISIISISTFAWIGIRAGTWFFFARFGTPTLLKIMARDGIYSKKDHVPFDLSTIPAAWAKRVAKDLKDDVDWFSSKGHEMIEAFVLPPLQILAVITNFFIILLNSKHLFNLPLRGLKDIKDTQELIEQIYQAQKHS